MVREQVGAFANFKRAVVVKRLPKTRSGKILRQIVRRMVDGKPFATPSTIDDPAILPEIAEALRAAHVTVATPPDAVG
jgi:propionyl-CoA synthetase